MLLKIQAVPWLRLLFESSVDRAMDQTVYSCHLRTVPWIRRFIRVICGRCHGSDGLFESSVDCAVNKVVYSSLLWAVSWIKWFIRIMCGLCHESSGLFESSVGRAMDQAVIRVFCEHCHGLGCYSPFCNRGVFFNPNKIHVGFSVDKVALEKDLPPST